MQPGSRGRTIPANGLTHIAATSAGKTLPRATAQRRRSAGLTLECDGRTVFREPVLAEGGGLHQEVEPREERGTETFRKTGEHLFAEATDAPGRKGRHEQDALQARQGPDQRRTLTIPDVPVGSVYR